MKRSILLITILSLFINVSASVIADKTEIKKTREQKKEGQLVAIQVLAKMSVAEYETFRGKKMTAIERLSFKIARKQAQLKLNQATDESDKIVGLLLGFFLGPFGVLAAYAFSKDKVLQKFTWIGFGISIALTLALVMLILAASYGR